VLNTAIFNPEDKAPLETLSLGMLSQAQFAWMEEEIRTNADKLCIVFAHHGPDAFAPLVTDKNTKYVSAKRLKESLKTFENVIAFVSGHTHVNRVKAEAGADGRGYWDINTCGVADWPQEWRRITVKDNGDGTGSLICRMRTYAPEILTQEIYRIWDPVAYKYLDQVYGAGDSIREVSAAENDPSAAGADADRDVELLFAMPAAVRDTIVAEFRAAASEEEAGSSKSSGTGDGDHDGRCFIAASTR
jgi:hypothetical protein